MWYNGFYEEASVEEQLPFGMSPEEMRAVSEEAILCDCCELCGLLRECIR
jgi:hypothetical protein